ncbi:hypothetical protein LguiA_034058 [Lonicera macranthoides]
MKCFYIFKDKSKPNQEKSPRKPKFQSTRLATNSKDLVQSPRTVMEMYKQREKNLRVFTFSELRNATHDFNKLLKIGEGGFGRVYKGSIRIENGQGGGVDSSLVVAIKKLNKHGLQGHKQWLAEVQFLGIVDHPNLVKLLGYCSVDGERGIQRLLVYEYMSNKSLEDHLFGRAFPTLSWINRLKIILGAAQGLAYLHEGLEVQVIYRDFKASNVLLDADFNPKLSDFGLAREGPVGGRSHVSTAPIGTYGYAAPEYIETGHLKVESDIWSFGIVVYEILTGRRVLENNRPRTEQKLLDWVKQFPHNSNMFYMIIDPRIKNQYSLSSARKIAVLADTCLNKNPKDRPKMSEVVKRLEQVIQELE